MATWSLKSGVCEAWEHGLSFATLLLLFLRWPIWRNWRSSFKIYLLTPHHVNQPVRPKTQRFAIVNWSLFGFDHCVQYFSCMFKRPIPDYNCPPPLVRRSFNSREGPPTSANDIVYVCAGRSRLRSISAMRRSVTKMVWVLVPDRGPVLGGVALIFFVVWKQWTFARVVQFFTIRRSLNHLDERPSAATVVSSKEKPGFTRDGWVARQYTARLRGVAFVSIIFHMLFRMCEMSRLSSAHKWCIWFQCLTENILLIIAYLFFKQHHATVCH